VETVFLYRGKGVRMFDMYVGPFRRYLWLEGRPSEPSWLGSWVDSPEHQIFQNTFFFSTPLFVGFFVFVSLSHFPVFVTFTVLLPPHDTRHPPPPYCTHLLPLSPPTLHPHPCLLLPSLTPSKPCPARLNSLFFPSRRHSSEESSPPTRPPTTVRRGTGDPPTP
jgi:hypothetical protein